MDHFEHVNIFKQFLVREHKLVSHCVGHVSVFALQVDEVQTFVDVDQGFEDEVGAVDAAPYLLPLVVDLLYR